MKRSLLVLMFLAIATCAFALEPPPSFLRTFGASGPTANRLQGPSGILFDAMGNVVIADGAKNRAVMFTSTGLYAGSYDTSFMPPRGVAVIPDGSIFVCSNASPYIRRIYSPDFGLWTPAGTAGVSYGIASDPSGQLYLSLTNLNQIKSWLPTGGAGAWGATLPPGAGPAGLWFADGFVWVACSGDHKIRVFDGTGASVLEWGGFGSGPGQFKAPQGLCVDGSDVYVADTQNHRVQKFTRDGEYLTEWGTQGTGNGQFNQPAGVAVAGNGEIYVTDLGNNRVQVFGTLAVPVATTTWGRIKTLRR